MPLWKACNSRSLGKVVQQRVRGEQHRESRQFSPRWSGVIQLEFGCVSENWPGCRVVAPKPASFALLTIRSINLRKLVVYRAPSNIETSSVRHRTPKPEGSRSGTRPNWIERSQWRIGVGCVVIWLSEDIILTSMQGS